MELTECHNLAQQIEVSQVYHDNEEPESEFKRLSMLGDHLRTAADKIAGGVKDAGHGLKSVAEHMTPTEMARRASSIAVPFTGSGQLPSRTLPERAEPPAEEHRREANGHGGRWSKDRGVELEWRQPHGRHHKHQRHHVAGSAVAESQFSATL